MHRTGKTTVHEFPRSKKHHEGVYVGFKFVWAPQTLKPSALHPTPLVATRSKFRVWGTLSPLALTSAKPYNQGIQTRTP